jgi:hypothetical protein
MSKMHQSDKKVQCFLFNKNNSSPENLFLKNQHAIFVYKKTIITDIVSY